MTQTAGSWETTGSIAPDGMVAMREQLRCAMRILGRVAETQIERQPDWGHAAFQWDGEMRGFVSGEVDGERAFRVALRLPDATALVLARDGDIIDSMALNGAGDAEFAGWLHLATAALGAGVDATTIAWPPEPCTGETMYDFVDDAALEELARYYANAWQVLATVREEFASRVQASPVRAWPHHFDIGSLLVLDPGRDPEEARSIGIGFSPGDAGSDEPYYYVNIWPYPDASVLPNMQGKGEWATEGWIGALLRASDMGEDQAGDVRRFVEFASGTFDSVLEHGSA